MSYTSTQAMLTDQFPACYAEEFILETLDDDDNLVFRHWLLRGHEDLTDFWAACEEETDVCTIADFTPSDWDGSYIAWKI